MKKYILLFSSLIAVGLFGCQKSHSSNEDTVENTSAKAVENDGTTTDVTVENVSEGEWIPLFNGKDLDEWTVRGKTKWSVENGVMIGEGGRGHIYGGPELTDLEVKGMFKLSDLGGGANSGLYFRTHEPAGNPDGWPEGYEAQICHNQESHTGWLWKPGVPTGKASALISKDDEWFSYRVKAVGNLIQIWVNDQLVLTHEDEEYKSGRFVLQGHNDGMKIEIKDLYYKDLSK